MRTCTVEWVIILAVEVLMVLAIGFLALWIDGYFPPVWGIFVLLLLMDKKVK